MGDFIRIELKPALSEDGCPTSKGGSDPLRPPQSIEFLIELRQNSFHAREFTEIYEG